MFVFEKNIYCISNYNKFAFSGQMNMKISADLQKNAPVLLKC